MIIIHLIVTFITAVPILLGVTVIIAGIVIAKTRRPREGRKP